MEINAGNILIILVGIVLCFFGIYLKRVTQIIMGFAWGAVIAFLLISGLTVGGMLDDSNEAIAILIVLAVGILMAVLAVKLERLLVMVQGVLLSFLICMVILGALLGNDGAAIAIILSLIISAVMGYLLWMYYRYAFICETAVVGSIMINHVWLIHGPDELNVFSVLLTIAVAAAGIKVQSMWLRKMEGGTTGSRINIPKRNGSGTRPTIHRSSGSPLFSSWDVQKAGMESLCTYEKCLVIIPIMAFFVHKIVTMYLYNISDATIDFFNSTWMLRNALMIILEGMFVGCVIYFIIYYEFKVAAIYQMLYLLWLPFQIIVLIQYSYVGVGPLLRNILAYYIPWLIFVGLDRVLHSEMLKITVITVASIVWFPLISEFVISGYWGFIIDKNTFLRWIGIAGTVLGLAWLRKNRRY